MPKEPYQPFHTSQHYELAAHTLPHGQQSITRTCKLVFTTEEEDPPRGPHHFHSIWEVEDGKYIGQVCVVSLKKKGDFPRFVSTLRICSSLREVEQFFSDYNYHHFFEKVPLRSRSHSGAIYDNQWKLSADKAINSTSEVFELEELRSLMVDREVQPQHAVRCLDLATDVGLESLAEITEASENYWKFEQQLHEGRLLQSQDEELIEARTKRRQQQTALASAVFDIPASDRTIVAPTMNDCETIKLKRFMQRPIRFLGRTLAETRDKPTTIPTFNFALHQTSDNQLISETRFEVVRFGKRDVMPPVASSVVVCETLVDVVAHWKSTDAYLYGVAPPNRNRTEFLDELNDTKDRTIAQLIDTLHIDRGIEELAVECLDARVSVRALDIVVQRALVTPRITEPLQQWRATFELQERVAGQQLTDDQRDQLEAESNRRNQLAQEIHDRLFATKEDEVLPSKSWAVG